MDDEEFPELTLIIGFSNQMYQVFLPFSNELSEIHDPARTLSVNIFTLFIADKLQQSEEYHINIIHLRSDNPSIEDQTITFSYKELEYKDSTLHSN